MFSQHRLDIGFKRSCTLWLLVIVVNFRKEYLFFYLCKKFKAIEEERNKNLLVKYTC